MVQHSRRLQKLQTLRLYTLIVPHCPGNYSGAFLVSYPVTGGSGMLLSLQSRLWAGHVARMDESKSAFKILTGTPTGGRPFGSPRRRWKENIIYNVYTFIMSLLSRLWAGHVARMEESRNDFKILTGKPIGRRPLGRPRRRWEDNIRMDFKEIGINTRNWVDWAQGRKTLFPLLVAAL